MHPNTQTKESIMKNRGSVVAILEGFFHSSKRLASIGLLGCVACAEAGEFDEMESDLAQVEQGYVSRGAVNFTYGVNALTAANLNCERNNSNQTCIMPSSKSITWTVINDGISDQETTALRTDVINAINRITAAMGSGHGWTFTEQEQPGSGAHINVFGNGNFCSGTLSNQTSGYVCLVGGGNGNLTENLPGTYQKRVAVAVHIDVTDIKNKGASNTEDTRFLSAAVHNGVLKALGIGGILGPINRCTSEDVPSLINTPNGCRISEGEACRMKSFTVDNTTGYTVLGNDQNCTA